MTSTCNFIMIADGELTATFDQNAGPFFLSITINLAGDGGGEVGVDNDRCQNYDYDPAHLPTQFSACTTFYAPNSVVKLEARPPVASRFETFSNDERRAVRSCRGRGRRPDLCDWRVTGSFVATLDVYDPGSNTWSPRDRCRWGREDSWRPPS